MLPVMRKEETREVRGKIMEKKEKSQRKEEQKDEDVSDWGGERGREDASKNSTMSE